MKPGMKMLMMDRMQRQDEGRRSEYGGGSNRRMIGYDRDRNGQANTSGYAEMEGGSTNYGNRYGGETSGYGENRRYYGMDMENETESRRRRDSRGRYAEGGGSYNDGNRSEYNEGRYGYGRNEPESRRRRDRRGRYMMEGVEDEEEEEMRGQKWFPPEKYMPPQNNMMRPGNSYGDIYAHGTLWAPGAMNKPMGQGGMYGGDMSEPVDERTARMWVQKMDGGEHFKLEQTEQHRNVVCPDCDMWEWYVAMNAMYSDYCETAKKLNVDRPDYYAHMAKDFLKDKDAGPYKLRKYMTVIPK